MTRRSYLLVVVFLLAFCGWLGLELSEQLDKAPTKVGSPPPTAYAKPELPAVTDDQRTFSLPPVSQLTEMVERPLFFEGRVRPVEAAPAPAAPGEPPGKIILVGVVISPDEETALVKPVGGDEVVPVSVGQSINSWKLEEIRHDRIVIRWEDRVEEVNIEDNKAPPAARKPAQKATGANRRASAKSGDGRRSPTRRNSSNLRRERGTR